MPAWPSLVDVENPEAGRPTDSATAAPFLDIVDVSTIKMIALALCRCSVNWSRSRGCPGTSTTAMGGRPGRDRFATFTCIDA